MLKILLIVHASLCGAGGFVLMKSKGFASLARSVITGLLEPTLILAAPTASSSLIATSTRPTPTIATSVFPFAALSLLHSPSLGRRRRGED